MGSVVFSSSYFSNISSTCSDTILYYKSPVIHQPTITTYDKKLTKRSTIVVQQYVNLYKNSYLETCKTSLYKDDNNDW
jgi:hypothetical protein